MTLKFYFNKLFSEKKEQTLATVRQPVLDLATHPLSYLASLDLGIKAFCLATYDASEAIYGDRNDRKLYWVDRANLIEEGSKIIRGAAVEGLDTTVCSQIITAHGATMHLPMVDFYTAGDAGLFAQDLRFKEGFLERWTDLVGIPFTNFKLYRSGRGHHGYGSGLLSPKGYSQYLASLLILPELKNPYVMAVADFRWVGHALTRGYAALRLSCVDEHYLQEPTVETYAPVPKEKLIF